MKKILIVDDESVVRESISELLVEQGYEVQTANNGREGIDVFESFHPDLVLTDISMPDMEGIEFLRILRKRKENLPIIAMSGNVVGTKFLESARLFGATAVLNKPFFKNELLCTIEEFL